VGVSHRESRLVSISKKRRRWSDHVQEQPFLDDLPAADVPIDARTLQELFSTNQISPRCRAVLTLHFQEDMSLAEVAAVLELPLGTVKSRLAYGLAALRKRLGDGRRL
jgi:RNA polymerase sigma factor (sigma-70 family)